jgi:hypothetical protein
MSDSTRSDSTRRPALLIQVPDDIHRKRTGGGGAPKVFGDVEQARARLIEQCEQIKSRLLHAGTGAASQVGVARLHYGERAIAKSHRVRNVFTEQTCRIIGDGSGPGDLLILVNPPALDRLRQRIETLGERAARHLTGIETLELVSLERRFPPQSRAEIQTQLEREGTATVNVRLPNFQLFSDLDRMELENRLSELFGMTSQPYVMLGNFSLYAVTVQSLDQAMAIASLQVVNRVELMPMYYLSALPSAGNIDVATLTADPDVPIASLPIVAVVDGGIAKGSPLEPFIWKRDSRVPLSAANTDHGTPVAALVASGGRLQSATFTPVARLLDAAVISAAGGVSQVSLVDCLEELLDLYAGEVKEWNLSLGRPPGAQPAEFSDLGQLLDLYHTRYQVQFYCTAGNCTPANQRMTWPVPKGQSLDDYVSAPGDAVCGITAGSCAPRNTPPNAVVPALAPAPYSGRGPVAAGVQKPDVAVEEGNLLANGTQIGMPTMTPAGAIRTDIVGTSFATPIVTSVGTELRSCLALGTLPLMSQLLVAKAMLVHHASIPAVFGGRSVRGLDYYGYGRIGSIDDMLEDPPWRSTSYILDTIYPDSGDLIIDPFPYPAGLYTRGTFRGRVLLTIVSEPVLDPSFKVEYVRSNVDVRLSVMCRGSDGVLHPEAPAKYLQPIADYESKLIKEYQKWSPIKQYRSVQPISCSGESWHLRATMMLRDEESALIRRDPMRAADYALPIVIAVTIEDPAQAVNVNDEMVRAWRLRGFVLDEVQVRPAIRTRINGMS